MKYRLQSSLFFLTLVIPGALLSYRIWNLRPLYVNNETRMAAKNALIEAVNREGWLLSNMLVRAVTAEEVRLIHRQHVRGIDPEACVIITLKDSSLRPCD